MRSLADALAAWPRAGRGALLLVLDQLEELFVYHDRPTIRCSRSWRRRSAAATPPSISCSRSARTRSRSSTGSRGTCRDCSITCCGSSISTRRRTQSAIVAPLERWNERSRRWTADRDRGGVRRRRCSTRSRPARSRSAKAAPARSSAIRAPSGVEAPYLQLVLERVWDEERRDGLETLRQQTLDRLGGATEIVRTHLDAALAALPSATRTSPARTFRHLVTPSGTKIALRIADLAEYADVDRNTARAARRSSSPATSAFSAPPATAATRSTTTPSPGRSSTGTPAGRSARSAVASGGASLFSAPSCSRSPGSPLPSRSSRSRRVMRSIQRGEVSRRHSRRRRLRPLIPITWQPSTRRSRPGTRRRRARRKAHCAWRSRRTRSPRRFVATPTPSTAPRSARTASSSSPPATTTRLGSGTPPPGTASTLSAATPTPSPAPPSAPTASSSSPPGTTTRLGSGMPPAGTASTPCRGGSAVFSPDGKLDRHGRRRRHGGDLGYRHRARRPYPPRPHRLRRNRRVQPGRQARRHGGRRRHGADLGRRHRAEPAHPPRPHRVRLRRRLQPRRQARPHRRQRRHRADLGHRHRAQPPHPPTATPTPSTAPPSAQTASSSSRPARRHGDGIARIWDTATGRSLHILRDSSVDSATFSPDGTLVLTAGDDVTARIWDAATGHSLPNPARPHWFRPQRRVQPGRHIRPNRR